MQKRIFLPLILLGLSLRIAVPAGFMPADLSGGWYLKLCPDGMQSSTMMALLGHDHHHADHGKNTYAQCELGGGLSSDATQNSTETTEPLPLNVTVVAEVAIVRRSRNIDLAHRSRAPPIS